MTIFTIGYEGIDVDSVVSATIPEQRSGLPVDNLVSTLILPARRVALITVTKVERDLT